MVRLVQVKPQPHYRLWLRYADGVQGEVDLSGLVGQGVFELWNDEREFQKAQAARSAVVWNNEVDLDAASLYMQLTGKKPEEVFSKSRRIASCPRLAASSESSSRSTFASIFRSKMKNLLSASCPLLTVHYPSAA